MKIQYQAHGVVRYENDETQFSVPLGLQHISGLEKLLDSKSVRTLDGDVSYHLPGTKQGRDKLREYIMRLREA